ncbi:MAG: hypothetical protein U0R18_19655 [Mycobacterium sp.]
MTDTGPERPDPRERVAEAVSNLRKSIDRVHTEVRDGSLTCGQVSDDLTAAGSTFSETADSFREYASNPIDQATVAVFLVGAAADLAHFLPFDDADRDTSAVEVAIQLPLAGTPQPATFPDRAEALTHLSTPATDADGPPMTAEFASGWAGAPHPLPPGTVQAHPPPRRPRWWRRLWNRLKGTKKQPPEALDLVSTMVERAAGSGVKVMKVGLTGVPDVVELLAADHPVIAQAMHQLGDVVHGLLQRALDFIQPLFAGEWTQHLKILFKGVEGIGGLFDILEIEERAAKHLVPILDNWLEVDAVRDALSNRDLSSADSLAAIGKLDTYNRRMVGWVKGAAPFILPPLGTITVVGVPALPIGIAVLLGWIFLVSADHLSSDIRWRPHVFAGILEITPAA